MHPMIWAYHRPTTTQNDDVPDSDWRTHLGLCDPLTPLQYLTSWRVSRRAIRANWDNNLHGDPQPCCLLLLFLSAKITTKYYKDWAWLSPSGGDLSHVASHAKHLVTDSRTKRQHDILGIDWWTWQVSRWSLLPSFECKLPDSLSCLSTPLEDCKFLLSSRTAYCHIFMPLRGRVRPHQGHKVS